MKNKIKITLHPFSYLDFSEKTNAIFLLTFLACQVFMLFITNSWTNLFVILAAVSATVLAEVFEKAYGKRKDSYSFINSIIQGILTGLFLPSTFPIYAVFFTVFFVFVCSRYFIGSFADCWINLPCLSVCICWILGTSLFPDWQLTHEIIFARNPSLELIQNGTFPMIALDTKITSFFNKTIFSLFGVSIPDGYISLFWDTGSLIPAFRFNFITLISSIVLISMDVVRAMIPGLFLLTYGILVFAGPYFFGFGGHGDLLLAFCTSGLLFSSIFLLQFAGTTPMSLSGKAVYAFFAGILAYLIIGAGTSPAGAVFTVLFMNVLSLFIQHIEKIAEIKKVKKILLERVKELEEGKNA
ncbi:RnfABCDGE type electron transport complex subunit D [Treponema sp.]|uniref:RnfABCDGE type electron transport complex subunit D n=1 Tax=Treponema sp. TaxID=166 RepID=UPI003FD8621E